MTKGNGDSFENADGTDYGDGFMEVHLCHNPSNCMYSIGVVCCTSVAPQ